MIVISMVNLKGGTLKTTSTAYLCAAFHEAGMSVIGVDADGENENLAGWREDGELPFPVIGQRGSDLDKQLPGILGDKYDVVVIDCPPMKAQRGTVASVIRYSTHVIAPLAPTGMDNTRLPFVSELVDEQGPASIHGQRPQYAALLVKCKASANSPAIYRELIGDSGVYVLKTQIADRERYAQAYGSPIRNAMRTEFGDLALELLDLNDDITKTKVTA
jgi:chromosome partitioning protein